MRERKREGRKREKLGKERLCASMLGERTRQAKKPAWGSPEMLYKAANCSDTKQITSHIRWCNIKHYVLIHGMYTISHHALILCANNCQYFTALLHFLLLTQLESCSPFFPESTSVGAVQARHQVIGPALWPTPIPRATIPRLSHSRSGNDPPGTTHKS